MRCTLYAPHATPHSSRRARPAACRSRATRTLAVMPLTTTCPPRCLAPAVARPLSPLCPAHVQALREAHGAMGEVGAYTLLVEHCAKEAKPYRAKQVPALASPLGLAVAVAPAPRLKAGVGDTVAIA